MKVLCWLLILFLLLFCGIGCDNEKENESTAGSDAATDDDPSADSTGSPQASSGQATDDDDDENARARVILPPFPFWPNNGFFVDLALIENLATDYCRETPEPSTEDFFFGGLPMMSFDLLFEPGTAEDHEALLGNLYISGLFGGVYLRPVLSPQEKECSAFPALQPIFTLLADLTDRQAATAETGTDDQVLEKAYSHIIPLLFIYAYNLGYLEQILAHPPDDVPPPGDMLECSEKNLLDCRSGAVDFPFRSRYDQALAKLLDPPGPRWERMAGLTEDAAPLVEMGAAVWNVIDISKMSEEDYLLLVRLSLNFLLVSRVSVLGNMTTWADLLPGQGRYSLLIDAGMLLWSGSYMMGLTPASGNELPELLCP